MPGSLTTPDRPGARNGASGRVAFRKMHCVGIQNRKLSRLNGWPMRPPVNASPRPSRAPAHDSGPMWIATPSSQGTCTLYSLPVSRRTQMFSVNPQQRTFVSAVGTSVQCHVWTAPSWQEHSSRLQRWSVQPCVRPLDAVHMTAGHNALRGSGPGQNLAFEDAVALVGCPDRRIDRLCITCCSPSQPSHHAGCLPGAISFYAASATGCL
jgi:hypothetical protein